MDKYKFADSEHLAGFHSTFQENCYECHRENRLQKAKITVMKEELGTSPILYRMDFNNPNPLEN